MLDIMLDLETMGVGPKAAIIAIGAVEFDVNAGEIGARFYRNVDLESSMRSGCEIDAPTMLWWLRQSEEARAMFSKEIPTPLPQALCDFSQWVSLCGKPEEVLVWGNGASFDNVILSSAYKATGLIQPWGRSNDRCYRTVKAQHPTVKLVRVGTHHNAADDAESQARHMIAMLYKGPQSDNSMQRSILEAGIEKWDKLQGQDQPVYTLGYNRPPPTRRYSND